MRTMVFVYSAESRQTWKSDVISVRLFLQNILSLWQVFILFNRYIQVHSSYKIQIKSCTLKHHSSFEFTLILSWYNKTNCRVCRRYFFLPAFQNNSMYSMITMSISFSFFITYYSKYSSLPVPTHLLSVLNCPILFGSFHTETTSGSYSSCFLSLPHPFKNWVYRML